MGDGGGGDLDREFERLLGGSDGALPPPSRESMREVKAEAKRRHQEQAARERAAKAYWAEQAGVHPSGHRNSWAWVGFAVVLGLAASAGFLVLQRGQQPGLDVAQSPTAPTAPAPAASAAAPEATSPPFADTPAAAWPVGAAGITLPEARRTGAYSAAQVREAARATRAYLEAAMLDERVLFDSKLKPVLRTMDRDSREQATAEVAADREKPDGDDSLRWTSFANRFRPGDWTADDEVRIRGRMKPTIGEQGLLEMTYVFVAAYWMQPSTGGPWVPVAVRREGSAYFRTDGRGVTKPWIGGDGITTSRSVCGSDWPYPQYLEAWADLDGVATASVAPLPAKDLSDPETTLDACFTDTSGF
jgi:hypothetical protein